VPPDDLRLSCERRRRHIAEVQANGGGIEAPLDSFKRLVDGTDAI
jgi:hypothetical protein